MVPQVVLIASLLAFAHGGLLLGNGLGGGLGGGIGIGGGIGLGGGIGIGGGYGGQRAVDLWAPPKYEYKYAVEDPHTADLKEQVESRVGGLTKSEYALAEKDRKIQVSRLIASVH